MDLFITKYCRLSSKGIFCNGSLVDLPFTDMVMDSQALYTQLNLHYPKFFKMDTVCRYGILASEWMFREEMPDPIYEAADIGIILSGKYGSLDTDEQFQNTLQSGDFFPSPALFVYTLSNIVMGEICIRYKIKGENLFVISDTVNYDLLYQYTTVLFEQKKVKACLVGWVDYYHRQPDILLGWIEQLPRTQLDSLSFNSSTLTSLYQYEYPY